MTTWQRVALFATGGARLRGVGRADPAWSFVPAAAVPAGWGATHAGFPQPSSL